MTDIKALVERLEAVEEVSDLHGGPAYALRDLLDQAAAALRDLTEWRPLNTATCDGRGFLVSAASWEGGCIVDWLSEERRDIDLHNWSDPPTHWLPLPSAPNLKETGE